MTTTTQAHTSLWRKIAATLIVLAALCAASVASAGETISYFHDDLVGSPVMATDVNGLQVWKETYRPYGDQLIDSASAQNNKIWFGGEPFDDSTGLSYKGARYYDPTLGRFMAVDPVAFDLDNLHSFNRYAYANNNPYRFVDPDGQNSITAAEGALLATAVVIVGCQVAGSCEKFGRAVWDLGAALNERLKSQMLAVALVLSGKYLNEEKKQPGESDKAAGEPAGESSEGGGGDDTTADRPPAGSKPISETPWSGDHDDIKGQIGAKPDDHVSISPEGDVWVQNPDGTWTNFGKAGDLTGSGQASGQSGKERDRAREEQRERRREKRNWDRNE